MLGGSDDLDKTANILDKYKNVQQGIMVESNSHSIMGRIGGARCHDYIELLYVEEGDMEVTIDANRYVVECNGIILIKPRETYFIEALSQRSKTISLKIELQELCRIRVNNLYSINIECLADHELDLTRVYSYNEINEFDMGKLVMECLKEWNDKESGFEWVIKSDIVKILVWILRRGIEDIPYNSGGIKEKESIRRAIEYMNEHLETVTATELAEYSGLSYGYFLKVFKEATGVGFGKFIQDRRLNESQKLLLETKKSITEIALEVGFSTTSHYIKLFKENVGVTPNKYRKRK